MTSNEKGSLISPLHPYLLTAHMSVSHLLVCKAKFTSRKIYHEEKIIHPKKTNIYPWQKKGKVLLFTVAKSKWSSCCLLRSQRWQQSRRLGRRRVMFFFHKVSPHHKSLLRNHPFITIPENISFFTSVYKLPIPTRAFYSLFLYTRVEGSSILNQRWRKENKKPKGVSQKIIMDHERCV